MITKLKPVRVIMLGLQRTQISNSSSDQRVYLRHGHWEALDDDIGVEGLQNVL